MKIYFDSLQQLSHDLINYLNDGTIRFSPRPYNFRNKDYTLWWLVPSQEWPAYKFGKISLYLEDNYLNIGLNVEKGFGPIVGEGYPQALKKHLVMDDNWQWNTFSSDVSNGIFDVLIDQQLNKFDEPFWITISAGIATDPGEYDPDAPKSDKVVFICTKDSMTLSEDNSETIFDRIFAAKSVEDLLLRIDNIEELPWIWCDFCINQRYELSKTESECITIKELLEKLKPFMKWVTG